VQHPFDRDVVNVARRARQLIYPLFSEDALPDSHWKPPKICASLLTRARRDKPSFDLARDSGWANSLIGDKE
jgi:hypothetical protein